MQKKEVRYNGIRWIDITKPGDEEAAFLREELKFHPLDVEDCLTPSQRSKVDRYPSYLFLVLLFPWYDKERRVIQPFEIDVFLTAQAIVTVQDRPGPVVNDLFRLAEMSEESRRQLLGDGPAKILETLLDRLLTATFPMIDHISLEVKEIEQRLFIGKERKFLQELLIARRNIAIFRKIMQAHKHVIRKVITTLTSPSSFAPLGRFEAAFENLVEYTKEIWDALDIQKEEVETLADTNESLISARLNDIMKNYTTLSVMIFAMTLLATLFALEVSGTPVIGLPGAFWYIVLLEALLAGLLYFVFRKKRWL